MSKLPRRLYDRFFLRLQQHYRRLYACAGSALAAAALAACSGTDSLQQSIPAGGSAAFAQAASVASPFGVVDATSASRSFAPLTLTWPKGAPAGGDLLVACVESQYAATPQTPAGWTALYSASVNRFGTALFYKLAATTEPVSVIFTIPQPLNISATMVRISGAAGMAPLWSHTLTSGVGTPATKAIVPNVLGMLPLACFGGVNATSYSVAGGWNLESQAGGGYATMLEQRQTITTDTSTGISVSATPSKVSSGTVSDAYAILVAPMAPATPLPTPPPSTPTVTDRNSASLSAGPLTLPWPNGTPASGDLLLACVESQYQATPQTPAGWTSLYAASAGRFGTALFYKIAGLNEPAAVVFAIPSPYNISASMVRISGARNAAPAWSHLGQAGAASATTPGIVPTALGTLPLACFGGVNATAYSVASDWSLDTQSRGGYATLIEQRQTATTDTSTAISVAATAASAKTGTFTDAYGLLVSPATTTVAGGVNVSPAALAFTAVAAPAQTVVAAQTGNTTFSATSADCAAVATIRSTGNGTFTISPVGVGACTFTILGSGGLSVALPVTTTSTAITVH